MSRNEKDIYNEENEVQNNWVKFSMVGDRIDGTLVSVREMKSQFPGQEDKLVKIYEIKGDGGEFHQTDKKGNPTDEVITIETGDFWNVGGKPVIDNQMRNVSLGTKIALKFTEEREARTKGFNPTKIIKVYVQKDKTGGPLLDEEWLTTQNDPYREEGQGDVDTSNMNV